MKKFTIFVFLLLITITLPTKVIANNDFSVEADFVYTIDSSGKTKADNHIKIENLNSNQYVPEYVFSLNNVEPEKVLITENNNEVPFSMSDKNGLHVIIVQFDNAIVGKGETREFTISYETSSFTNRTGEVWEISIPQLNLKENFSNYSVELNVPVSFGEEAYISPIATSSVAGKDYYSYRYSKAELNNSGINSGFGKFQVFSFQLNYHLENPLRKSTTTTIALPPDTSLQTIFYEDITPKPDNVYVDIDGNWIAEYNLSARERKDITAKGTVQIFSYPRPIYNVSLDSLNESLKESQYWNTKDPRILDISNSLDSVKDIYDYVVSSLNYNADRVKPNFTRLGSIEALNNSSSAICMEFTDLFIALARAKGIPAREINGYAYTENPDIQPIGLVSDVLHSWPEYWDKDRGLWIPLDPTWGNTTGDNYFDNFDLRHFTFVIHGKDAEKPYPPGSYKLGSNPQKDVYVSFGQLPADRFTKPESQMTLSKNFFTPKVLVQITNPGPSALYNVSVNVSTENKVLFEKIVESMPPFSKANYEIDIPSGVLASKLSNSVSLGVNDEFQTIKTNKNKIVILQLTCFFLTLLVLIILLIKFIVSHRHRTL